MRLIADSGSTKTDWVMTDGTDVCGRFQTKGINPYHQSEDDITAILRDELLPQLSCCNSGGFEVSFYGSGVRAELAPMMERLLLQGLPHVTTVEAHGDLLGAARAVCGASEGIACILGTGANSGLYDGKRMVANTPPLGYVLGDEGSGAVLGIRFLNALYKGFMPESLTDDFQRDMNMSMSDVISRVYRQPLANRFLASLSPFIHRHLDMPQVRTLVVDALREFFSHNIRQYQRPDLPVGFVGSIASNYTACLQEAASVEGFVIGCVIKSPMEGLVKYHQNYH